jgi:hypothetical protein
MEDDHKEIEALTEELTASLADWRAAASAAAGARVAAVLDE